MLRRKMALSKATIFAVVLLASILLKVQGNEKREALKTILRDYDNSEPPEGSTEVRIGLYINSFYAISEKTMDYSVSMYFRQAWQDKRLEFSPLRGEQKSKLSVPQSAINQLWLPDTFFRNEKGANFHVVTVPNRLLRINNTGAAWYVTKLTAKMSCPMKLQKFPFDTQMCPIMIESFTHTMDDMFFSWLNHPVDVDKDIQLPRFTLQDVVLYDCSQNYTAGAFPCLEVRFVLKRDTGYYIRQYFIPSMLIVIVSWMSFWLSPDATSARVGIGLTALVTTGALSSLARSYLPTLSYTTALEIWMGICVFFILASMAEFTVVHLLSRKEGSAKEEESKQGKEGSWKDAFRCSKNRTANSIDVLCRIIFPLAFLVFIIIYFIIYTV